jgi:hypothetical protein
LQRNYSLVSNPERSEENYHNLFRLRESSPPHARKDSTDSQDAANGGGGGGPDDDEIS